MAVSRTKRAVQRRPVRDEREAGREHRDQQDVEQADPGAAPSDEQKPRGDQRVPVGSGGQVTDQGAVEPEESQVGDDRRGGDQRTGPAHILVGLNNRAVMIQKAKPRAAWRPELRIRYSELRTRWSVRRRR